MTDIPTNDRWYAFWGPKVPPAPHEHIDQSRTLFINWPGQSDDRMVLRVRVCDGRGAKITGWGYAVGDHIAFSMTPEKCRRAAHAVVKDHELTPRRSIEIPPWKPA